MTAYQIVTEQCFQKTKFVVTAVRGNARHDFWFDTATRNLFPSPMNRNDPPKTAYIAVRQFVANMK